MDMQLLLAKLARQPVDGILQKAFAGCCTIAGTGKRTCLKDAHATSGLRTRVLRVLACLLERQNARGSTSLLRLRRPACWYVPHSPTCLRGISSVRTLARLPGKGLCLAGQGSVSVSDSSRTTRWGSLNSWASSRSQPLHLGRLTVKDRHEIMI